jgi:hypothetical protein
MFGGMEISLPQVRLVRLLLGIGALGPVAAVHVDTLGVDAIPTTRRRVRAHHQDHVDDVPLAEVRRRVAQQPAHHTNQAPLRVVLAGVLVGEVVRPALRARVRAWRLQ